ncbi:MAG TPA: hypothetical protein PKC37_04660, partial [Kaistella sp.]|nr:hypothetical protein [Kaistella sp.]
YVCWHFLQPSQGGEFGWTLGPNLSARTGNPMQTHTRAVVIGGGCVGAGILYGLTKRGWSDVVLLERINFL